MSPGNGSIDATTNTFKNKYRNMFSHLLYFIDARIHTVTGQLSYQLHKHYRKTLSQVIRDPWCGATKLERQNVLVKASWILVMISLRTVDSYLMGYLSKTFLSVGIYSWILLQNGKA